MNDDALFYDEDEGIEEEVDEDDLLPYSLIEEYYSPAAHRRREVQSFVNAFAAGLVPIGLYYLSRLPLLQVLARPALGAYILACLYALYWLRPGHDVGRSQPLGVLVAVILGAWAGVPLLWNTVR